MKESSETPLQPELTRSQVVEAEIERLRFDLKEVVSQGLLIIGMDMRNKMKDPPMDGKADVVVLAKPNEAKYTEELLSTEPKFEIIGKGESPIIIGSKEDVAIYLRYKD